MSLRFVRADVFTDVPFGGNPLAVFTDAGGLSDDLMQRLARELNLSETTFVAPAGDPTRVRMRIFTPEMELPFAGHPTIGSAIVLAQEGRVPLDAEGRGRIVLEQKAGPIAVDVRRDGDRWAANFGVTRALETRDDVPSAPEIALLLGLETADIGGGGVAPVAASLGVPFLLVPVGDGAALARVRLDAAAWRRLLADAWAPHVYVWTRAAADALRARMFAPAMGITEDPATGAAASALVAWLAGRDAAGGDGVRRWRIDQGVEMGRPALIQAAAIVRGGQVAEVRIGGAAVRIGTGAFDVGE